MSGTAVPVPIGAAATQKLSGSRTGWAQTRVGAGSDDTVTVHIFETPDERHNSRWVGTKLEHPRIAEFQATLPGWHRVRVDLDPDGQMHAAATYEGARLKAPEQPRRAEGIHIFWLDPEDEPERRTAVRDLARYFIMGWTKFGESTIARELHNRKDDVYPELSQIGLENERLLTRLAEEPEQLSDDEWDELEECGRLVMQILNWSEA